jgi:hypothetical protein
VILAVVMAGLNTVHALNNTVKAKLAMILAVDSIISSRNEVGIAFHQSTVDHIPIADLRGKLKTGFQFH